ncbi:hypothetical protein MUP01_12670 [Candidatus Bathyarchaeota archaeon]|nr:hypothetical protein [Candidatus Bathyarchaeota archaeon]
MTRASAVWARARATEKTETETCFNIRGQTAIVTGASSGLGITFAEAPPECKANVVLAARSIERLEKLAGRALFLVHT